MHPSAPEFLTLFAGYSKAHGTYMMTDALEASGKRKGRAATIKSPVTVELWDQHLNGKAGLGIIPINEASKVKFGAIDVDVYPINHIELARKIKDANLPLVVCTTKSNGAHLYMFTTDWVPALLVQERLRAFAAFLGFGGSEIFPRQTQILEERGDLGQWINMPYYGNTRWAIVDGDIEYEPEGFIRYVKNNLLVSQKDLEVFKLPINEILPNGPPCLQTLCTQGFPPGTRNNGLFNLGVYAKKAHPDDWKLKIEEYNEQFMDPPLTAMEVIGVIKSLNKKSFCYLCKQQPCNHYCNAERCRTMEYGVGDNMQGLPKLGTLTKLCTDPVTWFIEVESGGRLELTTDELQNPFFFQRKCMSVLNVMPAIPKRDDWEDLIRRLFETVNIVELPAEMTLRGQLLQHLEEFCTSRVQGKTQEDVLLGKPWLNSGRHYFRLRDFIMYLERNKFKLGLRDVSVTLKDLGAVKKFWNIKGKGLNVMEIPEFGAAPQTESFTPPHQETPPI